MNMAVLISFSIYLFLSLGAMLLLARFVEARKLQLIGKGTSLCFFPMQMILGMLVAISTGCKSFYGYKISPIFIIIASVVGGCYLLFRIFAPAGFPLADWANYLDKRLLYSPTKIYHDVVCMTALPIWAICVVVPAFIMIPWGFRGIIIRLPMFGFIFLCILCAVGDANNNPDPNVMHSATWREDRKRRRESKQ
jgi:hypothetical protein